MITLTPSDADFILKFLRIDLERLNENIEKLQQGKEDLKDTYQNSNIKDIKMATYMLNLAEEVTDKTTLGLNEVKNNLLHCIELLTTGSEVSK